jgi:hypothetical protein
MIALTRTTGVVLLLVLCACSFVARGPTQYREDVDTLIDQRTPQITQCYADHIGGDPPMVGNLVLDLTVSRHTGEVGQVVVVESETTVSDEMAECVQLALVGLRLEPPDWRDGQATYRWVFQTQST